MSLLFACAMAVAVDGDTLRCTNIEDANGRVRLARIDAPEMREQGGEEAKRELEQLIAGRAVTCKHVDADPRREGFQDRDPFGRVVARCFVGDVDLQAALLEGGHAEVWP